MVRRCFAFILVALVFAAAGTVTVDAAIAPGSSTPKVKPEDCGPDARPETGLQGQVPLADQRSGRSREGYRCNLALVGQNDIGGRGANFQLAWLGDCAYVGMVGQAFQSPVSPVEKGTKLAGDLVPRPPTFATQIQHFRAACRAPVRQSLGTKRPLFGRFVPKLSLRGWSPRFL